MRDQTAPILYNLTADWFLQALCKVFSWFWELFLPSKHVSTKQPVQRRSSLHHKSGSRRVLSEFQQLSHQMTSGAIPQVSDLDFVGDNVFRQLLSQQAYSAARGPAAHGVVYRLSNRAGHVTAGGSVCLEALSLGSSPCAWEASYTVESILRLVIANMTACEIVPVRTPTGPGGISGPLRVDLDGRWSGLLPVTEYSETEARSAFERTEANHRRHGW